MTNLGEPSSNNCMGFQPLTGTWYANDCSQSFPYICEVPKGSNPPPQTTLSPCRSIYYCEDGWTHYNLTNSCYKIFYNLTWDAAEQVCQNHNAHLASIHSFDENVFIESEFLLLQIESSKKSIILILFYFSGLSKAGVYWPEPCAPSYCYAFTWIGLHYISTEENWVWTDGTNFDYAAWGQSQPSQPGLHAWLASDLSPGWKPDYQLWGNDHNNDVMRTAICKKASLQS